MIEGPTKWCQELGATHLSDIEDDVVGIGVFNLVGVGLRDLPLSSQLLCSLDCAFIPGTVMLNIDGARD